MIRHHVLSAPAQLLGESVDVLAARAVDDAGLAFVAFNDLDDLLRFILPRQHAIGEVRPVEIA
ncbi:MAG TPA: hypothetical protein VEK11_13745, partial [Thermoanaerobaculia bacterium]|nr:hypothetical protein [Thermoanaerobaculia bacterium]